jgi:hypothetical protein
VVAVLWLRGRATGEPKRFVLMRGRGDSVWPVRDLWFLSFQKGGGAPASFFFLKDERGATISF